MHAPILADLIRSAPRLARPELAAEWLAEWRSARAELSLPADPIGGPQVEALLGALADHSPYLWRLVCADPRRLDTMLSSPPARFFDDGLAELDAGMAAAAGMDDAKSLLRRAKSSVALIVALADLGGVWGFEEVTAALTRFADAAVAGALRFLLREAARAGRLVIDPVEPETGCGITVLALGKGGGGELNYSSDIDLVVLYEAGAGALSPDAAPASVYVKLTQQLVRLLGERTEEGYVLRVDLRLRPDPASTAVALSLPAAFAYYETLGQNWERAAFIKARPVAGDKALGRAFLADLAPFIWRKYFDYAAIADIHAMKRQIHAVRGHAEVTVAGHDVKVGRGGIREIEFFVQTQQLIFGGRRPQLRGARTLDMLVELHADAWVSAEAVADLSDSYRFLRRIEHRLQMLADEQTQRLPSDPETLARFAAWAGYDTTEAFEADVVRHLRAVEAHYARLFEHAPGLDVEAGSLVFAGPAIEPETVETLRTMGFERPAEAVELVRGWHFGRRASIRSARAREVLTELVPALLLAFAGSGDPDAALAAFDDALARLPAVIELFAILKQNGALRELFADILGLAPRLAAAVTRRPHLLDAAIDPASLGAAGAGADRRLGYLDPARPTEEFLDRARDLAQEEMFLIGVRLLAGTVDPAAAGRDYSDLAVAVLRATLDHCRGVFAQEHGHVPGASCVAVALGRLGSAEMTATSDLDLLLIYDAASPEAESDGPRPLDAARYFSRLTQRFIAALTVTTRRGRLYEVDMRLRPSGRQGPVATRFSAFLAYQAEAADLWEHMALTRARVVAGDAALAGRVEAAVRAALTRPRGDEIGGAIVALRALVAQEKGEADAWDLKLAAGGMLDVDFIAQYLALRHGADHPDVLAGSTPAILRQAARLGLLAASAADGLGTSYKLYTDVSQITRLTTEGRFDPAKAGNGLRRRLVAVASLPDFAALECDLAERRASVRALFLTLLGAPPAAV